MEKFNFEELEVWQKAVAFADKILELTENFESGRRHYRLLAIRFFSANGPNAVEFVHFLHIARGSLFETVTLLIIFQRRAWITKAQQLTTQHLIPCSYVCSYRI